MRPTSDVHEVFRLRREHGWGAKRISDATGVSITQVGRWIRRSPEAVLHSPMREASAPHDRGSCSLLTGLEGPAYAYLLGQYLGDGSIVRVGRSERLEIHTTATWPGVRQEVVDAIVRVLGRRPSARPERHGVVRVVSYSCHWPCLFPQHGPGKKHLRSITLLRWQRELALDRQPGQLARGLIHSDGWRGMNVAIKGARRYHYSRYQFSNRSADIRRIFTDACDALGVDWRTSGPWTISVSRREAVAVLDRHIGPKY